MSASFFARHLDAYPRLHQDRINLAIHLFAVPVFIAGFFAIPVGLATGGWLVAASGAASALVSAIVQGRGHARERERPTFGGAGEAVLRLLAEQLVTFPRFILGGGFARAWRAARP